MVKKYQERGTGVVPAFRHLGAQQFMCWTSLKLAGTIVSSLAKGPGKTNLKHSFCICNTSCPSWGQTGCLSRAVGCWAWFFWRNPCAQFGRLRMPLRQLASNIYFTSMETAKFSWLALLGLLEFQVRDGGSQQPDCSTSVNWSLGTRGPLHQHQLVHVMSVLISSRKWWSRVSSLLAAFGPCTACVQQPASRHANPPLTCRRHSLSTGLYRKRNL